MRRTLALVVVTASLAACTEEVGRRDAARESAASDANTDAGSAIVDAVAAMDAAAVTDSGASDAAATMDSGSMAMDAGSGGDAATDVLVDTGVRVDTGVLVDSGVRVDSGVAMGGCISGAVGTHVARIRWTGTGPSSRANVSYEANTLPDRSRWRAGAYSRGAIGSYTPTFTDTGLGEGGLELSGTNFIDIELSTGGLGSISNVTIAMYGRSFNTVSPGSYAWMTFDGSGATPSGAVFNSAPYQWYRADATTAFRPGNTGVLLRFSPAGPSSSLIVNRVELCFDAR